MTLKNFNQPNSTEIRSRIDSIPDRSYRNALKFSWLGLCRVSEVVGEVCPSDVKTTARGPTGGSVEYTEYINKGEPVEVALFTVNTSKRGGLPRIAAYPLDRRMEPWSLELYEYFKEFQPDENVFPFTRQKLWSIATKAFKGLSYPIEEYTKIIEDEKIKVESHPRSMGTHAIRHIRAVDLLSIYGFNVQELSVIGGWTLRSMTGASGAISRYAHLGWNSYFEKLLIKRF